MFTYNGINIFATRGTTTLGEKICYHLSSLLTENFLTDGKITLSSYSLKRFDNENFQAEIAKSVRNNSVSVIHTHSSPIYEGYFELFTLLDAIQRSKAGEINLILPYLALWRSEKKDRPKISVMAKRFIKFLETYKPKVLLLNPHTPFIKHYFDEDADEITAMYLIADHLKTVYKNDDCCVVFSDVGATKNFEDFPALLDSSPAYIYKRRNKATGKIISQEVIGNVSGKICVLIDDEVLTGRTIIGDAELLMKAGAKKVIVAAIHGIFSKKDYPDEKYVIDKLNNSPIEKIYITDSVPHDPKIFTDKFVVLSVAKLLANAIVSLTMGNSINRLHGMESVSLYKE